MKIAFRKIANVPKDIALEIEGIFLQGQLERIDSKIVRLKGKILGDIELICDNTGEEYIYHLDVPLVLYISDGIWDSQSQSRKLDSFEVIEFFDGFIDLHYILESEIESIRSDYHTKDLKE